MLFRVGRRSHTLAALYERRPSDNLEIAGGHRPRSFFQGKCRRNRGCHQNGDGKPDKFRRNLFETLGASLSVTRLDDNILVFDPAVFPQPFPKLCVVDVRGIRGGRVEPYEPNALGLGSLLRFDGTSRSEQRLAYES